MSDENEARLGPAAAAVVRARIEGSKRKRIAGLIALFVDNANPSPSIKQLAVASKLDRNTVVAVVDALECDGLLRIRRGDNRAGERNVYALTLPALPDSPTNPKEITDMSSATKPAPIVPLDHRPDALRPGLFPPLTEVEFDQYEQIRNRHEAATTALAEATSREAEYAALSAIADALDDAQQLPDLIDAVGQSVLNERREELLDDSGVAPMSAAATEREVQVRALREDTYSLRQFAWSGTPSLTKLGNAAKVVIALHRRLREAREEDRADA